jgi:predicted RNA-binding protein with TRAM domain
MAFAVQCMYPELLNMAATPPADNVQTTESSAPVEGEAAPVDVVKNGDGSRTVTGFTELVQKVSEDVRCAAYNAENVRSMTCSSISTGASCGTLSCRG